MKKFKKIKGFTLVEILVVTAIIGILTAMVMINYRSGQRQLALQRAGSKLAQDIRVMQEKAMAVSRIEGCFDSGGEPRFSGYEYGFGIHFGKNSETYQLFADCNGNNKWNNPSVDEDFTLDSPDMISVIITKVYDPDASEPNKFNKADIVFTPPDPTVSSKLIDPGEEDKSKVSIEIALKDDLTKTKTITVYITGLIEIQ